MTPGVIFLIVVGVVVGTFAIGHLYIEQKVVHKRKRFC